MKIEKDRMDKAVPEISLKQAEIVTLSDHISQLERSFDQTLQFIRLFSDQSRLASSVLFHLEQFVSDVTLLKSGILTPSLISNYVLNETLTKVQARLHTEYPGFTLSIF